MATATRKQIVTEIAVFNKAKIGKAIKLGAKDDLETIKSAFLAGVESVPEAKEDELPDSVANLYNTLVDPKCKLVETAAEAPAAMAKAAAKGKAAPAKKAPAEKKVIEVDYKRVFESDKGFRAGSTADRVIQAVACAKKGMTQEDLETALADMPSSNVAARVKSVAKYAIDYGLFALSDKGVYTIINQ